MTTESSPSATSDTPPSPSPINPPNAPITSLILPPLTTTLHTTSTVLSYITARNSKARSEYRSQVAPEILWTLHLGFAGALGGFITGFYLGGRQRSYQFLAENAHRLPKTVGGWYYYHKYKNYEIIAAGFSSGFKYAGRFGMISAGFAGTEAVLERVTGRESWVNTVGAGLAASLAFSGASRLTFQYTKYAVLFGLGSSLLVGLLEDAYAWKYGESVKYPERVRAGDAFWIPGWETIKAKQEGTIISNES